MANITKDLKVFSPQGVGIDQGAVEQIERCLEHPNAVAGALMADHHLGYSMPIGGVVAYEDAISPTGVGFDIACGNMAVKTDLNISSFGSESAKSGDIVPNPKVFKGLMREIQRQVSFGIGRSNANPIDHPLFDNPVWVEIDNQFGRELEAKARNQLGTVGSGNHYVDILVDEKGALWIANHFGSRGLGHTIASGFMAAAAGRKFTDRVPESEDAVVLTKNDPLIYEFYIEAMQLAGEYAYAGREYVIDQVLKILGAEAVWSVHNHHNYAWLEDGKWVVRKGATPLTNSPAFIGGSMGDISVIVRGRTAGGEMLRWTRTEDVGALGSAPHGAGRIMSRTKAAGKLRKMWVCPNRNCGKFEERAVANTPASAGSRCPDCNIVLRKVRKRDTSDAAIDWTATRQDLKDRGIIVLGAGADEAPGVYKPLAEVIEAHPNIEILHTLRPLGVVMAGADEFDPYAD